MRGLGGEARERGSSIAEVGREKRTREARSTGRGEKWKGSTMEGRAGSARSAIHEGVGALRDEAIKRE
jgi:hypothetical protein